MICRKKAKNAIKKTLNFHQCFQAKNEKKHLYNYYGWNKVSGTNTIFFTAGNCSTVFLIRFERINIRADQPSVNPGTSENSRDKVQSLARLADNN
jgi:hypothetical protein